VIHKIVKYSQDKKDTAYLCRLSGTDLRSALYLSVPLSLPSLKVLSHDRVLISSNKALP
jgi:hypothetical protein